MSYFIFGKNLDSIENSIYRIAENESNLNDMNIIKFDYKIIEDSQSNFNSVKYGNKFPLKYDNDVITYVDQTNSFINEQSLQIYINNYKNQIKQFTNNNLAHPLLSIWDNYYNQLNNLDLKTISYPLNTSLEQYFNDQNQTSLNPLQLP